MDMGYKVPDYSGDSITSQKEKKNQKMKTVYPTLELRGQAAINFLKAHPDLKLGEVMHRGVKFCVVGMKQAESTKDKYPNDYDNCVSLDVESIDDKDDETEMNDEDMPKD